MKKPKIVINLGRTRRYIDTIRYITNGSSGQMGYSLYKEAKKKYRNIKVFFGDNDLALKENKKFKYCMTNDEMLKEIKKDFIDCDIFISSLAATDFKPLTVEKNKIRKSNTSVSISLIKDIDILQELGKLKTKQILVGFCLLDILDINEARIKMQNKNLNYIILNTPKSIANNYSEIVIISKEQNTYLKGSKRYLAKKIVQIVTSDI